MFSRYTRYIFSLSNSGEGPHIARLFAKKTKNVKEEQASQFSFDIEKVKREMEMSLKHFESHLQKISVGRGDPRMFDKLYVQAKHTELSNLACVTPVNANEISIKPFDVEDVENVLLALNTSSIKMQTRKEGNGTISVTIPKATQEFRSELVRQAREFCEEAKQNIRSKRQNSLHGLKDAKSVGEDEIKRIKNDVQKVTDRYAEQADKMLKEKEKILNS